MEILKGKWNDNINVEIVEENGKWKYTIETHGQVITKKLGKKFQFGFVTMDNGKFKLHHNQMKETSLVNKYYQIENLYDEIAVIKYY